MDASGLNVMAAWLLDVGDELLAAAAASGLSATETAALIIVSNDPGRSVDWLRARLQLSHSGTVRLLDRLVALDVIHRAPAVHDGRTIALTTTAEGDRRIALVHDRRARVVDRLLSALPEATIRAFEEVARSQLRERPRDPVQADITCRLCDLSVCTPRCPVTDSLTDPPPAPPSSSCA